MIRLIHLFEDAERIDELSRPDSHAEARRILLRKGYEILGSGLYGYVYGKPGAQTVIKIFHHLDTAYAAFVRIAKKHADNPHFPKIVGNVLKINDMFYGVRMERLNEYENIDATDADAIYAYISSGGNHRTKMSHDVVNISFEKWPRLKEACDIIIDELGGYPTDIGTNNIMIRDDGFVVISDPVSPVDWRRHQRWDADLTEQQVINELSIPDGYRDAQRKLEKSGWEFISDGNYSEVYARDDRDYVLKLFTPEDKAYVEFIKLCQQHQNNPHFPKIKRKGIVKINDIYHAVRIEKLQEIRWGDLVKNGYYPVMIQRYFINKWLEFKHKPILEYPPGDLEKVNNFLENNPKFKEALDIIASELLFRFHPDLHSENIMLRGDGTLVITDPISVS